MKNAIFFIFLVLVLYSCGGRSEDKAGQAMADSVFAPPPEEMKSAAMDESSSEYEIPATDDQQVKKSKSLPGEKDYSTRPVSLNQNLERLSDTVYLNNVRLSKKFIKTADFKFKVKHVETATKNIENLAINLKGYVQQSQIKSNYISGRTIELNADSMLSVFEYYVDNQIIIRVPAIYFDSVLNEISKLHIYLDYRNIKTEDVSTTFLRNKLKAEKKTEYEKRIQKASDAGNRKLDDIVEAERQASELADIAIDKKIENYELQDRIDFSSITLDVYQANSVFQEKVKNTRLYKYQPNFWQRAWEAIQTGWNIVLTIIIGLIYLWPLYLLAVIIYFGIKTIRKKFRKE